MNNIPKFLFMVLVLVIVVLILVTGGNVIIFWNLFGWVQGYIHETTGLDSPLDKALAALALAVVVMFPLGKMLLAFSPIPQKDKGKNRSLFFGAIAAFFLLVYFGAKDVYFNPNTGEAVRYYSQLPNGEYRFFSSPGFDPQTGVELKKVTADVVLKSQGLWKTDQPAPPASPTYAIPEQPRNSEPPVTHSEPEQPREERSAERETAKKPNSLISLGKYNYVPPEPETDPTPPPSPQKTPVIITNASSYVFQFYTEAGEWLFDVKSMIRRSSMLPPGNYYYRDEWGKIRRFVVPVDGRYVLNLKDKPARTLTRDRWN